MPDITSWVSLAMVALVLLALPLLGAFMAATPYLMPKGECFAVTIPDGAACNPYLRGLKRRFALIVGSITVIGIVLTAAMLFWRGFGPCIAILLVATLAIVGGGYALMLRYRSKVRAYKRQRGWRAEGETQVSFVGNEPFAKPLSIKWDLLFLIPIALTAVLGIAGYASMPDMLPLRVDLAGNITSMQPKSPGLVAFPVIAVTFVSVCLAVYHWSIVRSKRLSDPAMPAASAWAYARFARAHSVLIVVVGLLAGFIGPLMELMFAGVLTIWEATGLCLAVVLPIVVGAVAVSVVYGQNGSRLLAHVEGSDRMMRDDDRYWKAGIFYVNRDDASLFLPERFGIGWTLNWARPAAWALTIALVLVIAAFVVAALLV